MTTKRLCPEPGTEATGLGRALGTIQRKNND